MESYEPTRSTADQLELVLSVFSEADSDGAPTGVNREALIDGLKTQGAISEDIANLAKGWME